MMKRTLKPHAEEPDSVESKIVHLAMTGKIARAVKRDVDAGVAAGLPITFKQGNKVIKQYPDGKREIIGTITRSKFKFPKGVRAIVSK